METSTAQTTTPTPVGTAEDKTVAIVSYLTLVGFIVAVILHTQPGKKTALGAFHMRQMLGLIIASLILAFCNIVPILGQLVFFVGELGLFVFWVMGLIAAANGQMKPMPLIGPLVEKHLGTVFA
jgi:uncharacterized membrane protein